jgi:hypothetical protein
VIQKAVGLASGNRKDSVLERCLADVAFHRLVLVREWVELARANAWAWSARALREAVWGVYSGVSNTKFFLEDVFEHVSLVSRQMGKNGQMSDWSRYYHAAMSPKLHNGSLEINSLQVQPGDGDVFPARDFIAQQKIGNKIFHAASHKPCAELKVSELLQKTGAWKAAGVMSERRCVAAVAALEMNADTDFADLGALWTGVLLGCKLAFQFQGGDVFLSLGFSAWAAAGLRMQKTMHEGKAWVACWLACLRSYACARPLTFVFGLFRGCFACACLRACACWRARFAWAFLDLEELWWAICGQT